MTKVREPSSIIDMVEMCRIANQRIVDTKTFDDETRATARGVLEALSTADCYELEVGVVKATDMMFETQFSGRDTDKLTLDADCRLPSKVCLFWSRGTNIRFPDREEEFPFAYLAIEDEAGKFSHLNPQVTVGTVVCLISPYFGAMLQGSYMPEVEGGLYGPEEGSEDDKGIRVTHVLTVASMCSILNQPSFTKKEPAGSRQERRAAKRSGHYASDAWHKITWNIGEEVKAKLTRDEPVRCMPLHYTRGHWRRAEEGWKNTTLRKDGLWYQWIEGFWSGHPAFGIKKSYHAPKMGDAA